MGLAEGYFRKLNSPIDDVVKQAANKISEKKKYLNQNVAEAVLLYLEIKGINTEQSTLELKPKKFKQAITAYCNSDGNNTYISGAPTPFQEERKNLFRDFLKDLQKELNSKEIKPEEANQKPKTKIKLEKASKKLDISAEDIIGSIKTGKSLSEDTIYLLKETNKDNKIKNFKLFINLTEELSGVLRPELFKIFKNSTQANNKDSNNLKLFSDPEPTLHITQSSFVIESNIECVVTDFKQKLIELIQNPRLYFFEKSGKDIEKFNSEEIHQTIESLSGVKIKQITKVKEAGVEFGG